MRKVFWAGGLVVAAGGIAYLAWSDSPTSERAGHAAAGALGLPAREVAQARHDAYGNRTAPRTLPADVVEIQEVIDLSQVYEPQPCDMPTHDEPPLAEGVILTGFAVPCDSASGAVGCGAAAPGPACYEAPAAMPYAHEAEPGPLPKCVTDAAPWASGFLLGTGCHAACKHSAPAGEEACEEPAACCPCRLLMQKLGECCGEMLKAMTPMMGSADPNVIPAGAVQEPLPSIYHSGYRPYPACPQSIGVCPYSGRSYHPAPPAAEEESEPKAKPKNLSKPDPVEGKQDHTKVDTMEVRPGDLPNWNPYIPY